ncbi:hypothetical protein [Adlercreutzia aquisgranensis]|uniref:hypothetical protein n=1 Tax=Adlercreutzia aquisgranensis TaxID=2941323 RepID=UPI00203C01F0|nr:hypothetical protein [Adlercreutzia aquisgranensis]
MRKLTSVIVSILLMFSLVGLGGCYRSSDPSKSAPASENVAKKSQEKQDGGSSQKDSARDLPQPKPEAKSESAPVPEPEYEDSRWPTNNPTLLEVPESERWYNAWDQAWTNCTVVGPVKKVYQAKDSYGMPIFVDIGEAYPGANRVTLVIWAESLGDLEEMLNDVAGGGAWLSVTGYLSVYNDTLQFNIDDGPISFQWWAKS